MKRWIVWAPIAALALALLFWLAFAAEPVPVRVVEVQPGRVESTVTNTKAGTVLARRRAKLAPEVGGRIARIAHREGARVEAGAVLMELDSSSQRAELELARQSLRAAEASHREACIRRERSRRSLARQRELAERNVVSEDLLDELQSAYDAARASCNRAAAEVDRARAQIVLIETTLDKLQITAPFDGILAEVQGEVGEWITPSPPLLVAPAALDLIDLSSLYISAPMDEVDAAAIRTGLSARVTVDSYPGRSFEGEVVRVAPYVLDVEAQNRTLEIEVELRGEGPPGALLPGTSADVEVVRDVRENVLRVPTPALLRDDHLLVLEGDRLAEIQVETGLRNWNWTEVEGGLEAGARVVISLDRPEIADGAQVSAERVEYQP